jgi:DNA-binding response OmpR family regulator
MAECADEWLRKPFDVAELPHIIRNVVDQRRGE